MDPLDIDTLLSELLEEARAIAGDSYPDPGELAAAADNLARDILTLDEWIARNGHVPLRWTPTPRDGVR